MARFIILVFLVAMAAAVIAAPVEEESAHLRVRRVTCDLLSYGGKIGDSACAARCLVTGKRGGHCEGGVCNCRK